MNNELGIVVIGRNESRDLGTCLASVRRFDCPTVYVDSGSTDASVAIARELNMQVLQLDESAPFSAARARNAGFQHLLTLVPSPKWVQFVDGDCYLEPAWCDQAMERFRQRERLAVAFGRLTERFPQRSIYNLLCDLEWRSGLGDLKKGDSLGGLFMVRTDIFERLGGFKPEVIAGEDSELGVRIGLAGWEMTKLDQLMATHDANLLTFAQWWRRTVRSGHAIGQRAWINGDSEWKDCIKERRSVVFWGVLLPLFAVAGALILRQWSSLVVAASCYALLAVRVFRYRRGIGDKGAEAVLYAVSMIVSKFAQVLGLARFYLNTRLGRYRIIE